MLLALSHYATSKIMDKLLERSDSAFLSVWYKRGRVKSSHKCCPPIWNWISEFMERLICQLCVSSWSTWVPGGFSNDRIWARNFGIPKFDILRALHYALSPLGILKLRICQNDDLGSHFIKPELFQMKIFGCYLLCSFTFNSYLGTSWKQSPAAVKLPKNQLQFKQAAEKMWINLRGPVDQSH